VDLWSIGVITYVLLCGYPPFWAQSQPGLVEKIINASYDFPDREWSHISDTAKDFISSLLVLDPKKRLTTEECLKHGFLQIGNAPAIALPGFEKKMTKYTEERKRQLTVFRAQSLSAIAD